MSFRNLNQGKQVKIKIPKSKILPKYINELTDFKTERLIYWGGAGSG